MPQKHPDKVLQALKPEDKYIVESNSAIGFIPANNEYRSKLEAACEYQAKRSDDRMWAQALQWFSNYAFVVGNHWPGLRWNGSVLSGGNVLGDITSTPGSSFTDPVNGAGINASALPRIIDNLLVRPYAANVSRLNAARPQPRVTPASDSAEDEEASQLAELVLLDSYERLKMPAYQRAVAELICIEGTAALEPHFGESDIPREEPKFREIQSDAGKIFAEFGDDEAAEDTEVVPAGTEVIYDDELQMDVWGAFELTADRKATGLPDSETWFLRTTYVDINWAQDAFNINEQEYFPGNLTNIGGDSGHSTGNPLYWKERVKDLLDTPGTSFGVRGMSEATMGGYGSHEACMRVFDVKPNLNFPRGRTLVTLDGKLVFAADARNWTERYPERWHRYNIFRYWRIPSRWRGMPLLTPLIPLQQRVNAIDELERVNRELMAFGRWLVPKTNRIPDGLLSGGIPGVEVVYQPDGQGNKPEKIGNMPMPPEIQAERRRIVDEIDKKSGIISALEGEGNSGVRANSMLDSFNQERFMASAAMIADFEDSLESTFEDILREFSTADLSEEESNKLTDRLRVLAQEHSSMAIREFSSKNLRDGIHVDIDIASAMLNSPEAKRERALMMLQYIGKELSEADRYKVAGVIDEYGIGEVDNEQVRRARKMVSRCMSGEWESVEPRIDAEDPAVFAAEFQKAYLADRFTDIEEEAQERIKELFGFYTSEVQKRVQQAQEQQLMLVAMNARAEQGMGPGEEPREEGAATPTGPRAVAQ